MVLHQVPILIFGLVTLLIHQSSAGAHLAIEVCSQETGATIEDAQNFMNTGDATQNLKCAFGCVMKRMNVINDDGTMKTDVMLKYAPADKAEIVTKCSSFPPGEICENANLHFKCYLENDAEYFKYTFNRLLTEF